MIDQQLSANQNYSWSQRIKKKFESCGLFIWEHFNKPKYSSDYLCHYIEEMMTSNIKESYTSDILSMSPLERNQLLDYNFKPSCVCNINSRKQRSFYSRLRMGTLQLEIETGRYKNTRRDERICKQCNCNILESDTHFLFNCEKYSNLRSAFYSTMTNKFMEKSQTIICF